MQRREFIKVCAAGAAVSADGLFAAQDLNPHFYSRTLLMDEGGRPLRAASLVAGRNYIFLEEPTHYSKEFCVAMLRRAAAHARKTGSVIVIGHHYYHGTYDGLVEEVPKLQAEGFEFVFASELVK